MKPAIAERISKKKRRLESLLRPSSRDIQMERSFPLGVGFGRGRNRGKSIEAEISRARLVEKLRGEIASLELRIDRPARVIAPRVPRTPIMDRDRICVYLRMDGRCDLADGWSVEKRMFWSDSSRELEGEIILTGPGGAHHTQAAGSAQGGDMEDAAIALLVAYGLVASNSRK